MDGYCERLGPGLWAEPLNAVSNLGFLIAAVLFWYRSRHEPWSVRVLSPLILLIFLGSSAFHTTATRWGAAADSGFIAVFLLWYVVLFAHLYLDLPWHRAWLAAPIFLVVAVLTPGMYPAAVAGLAVLAILLAYRKNPRWREFVVAGVIFAVSLTLRTLDGPLCGEIPIGTHYLWHLLNAITLYLVAKAATGTRSPHLSSESTLRRPANEG